MGLCELVIDLSGGSFVFPCFYSITQRIHNVHRSYRFHVTDNFVLAIEGKPFDREKRTNNTPLRTATRLLI